MTELFRRHVAEMMAARHNTIETACEAALVTGTAGVTVVNLANGTTLAFPDGLVPYGQLFEFPSRIAYENWVARGCPK